jgi:coiled-coil domain-containing protein 63/114
LENRLDKANQKFNEAISVNRNLRENIDSLRRERVIFDNLYRKLEKELHDKRKKMAEIIETANNAYEDRDKANDQIEHLKSQAKTEAKDFENELKELSQLAELNRKAREFANLAGENKDMELGMNQLENDKMNRTKNPKMLKETAIDPNLKEEHRKLFVDFAKIQAATHIKKFDDLITNFVEMEEKNFNMFKYVIDLSNEVENLEKQILEYKEEKKKYEGKGNDLTVKKNNYLKGLDKKSIESRNKAELYSSKYSAATKNLNQVK